MSHQQQQFPYDFSGVDYTASLYQASQATPSLASWQQPQSGPIPYAASAALAYADTDLINGGTQSRVEDWATQAVAATLHQVRLFCCTWLTLLLSVGNLHVFQELFEVLDNDECFLVILAV